MCLTLYTNILLVYLKTYKVINVQNYGQKSYSLQSIIFFLLWAIQNKNLNIEIYLKVYI